MGKGLLIVLAGAVVVGLITMSSAQRMTASSDQENTGYEQQLLAREIATSAMNLVVAEAQKDFSNFENKVKFTDEPYQSGKFSVQAHRLSPTAVRINVTGEYSDKEHSLSTTLVRAGALDAAIEVEAPVANFGFAGTDFFVSGNDTPPPSETGGGRRIPFNKHGVQFNTPDVRDAFRSTLGAGRKGLVTGAAGEGDVVSGAFKVNLQDLYTEARAKADRVIQPADIVGGKSYGSKTNPEIVVVKGDAMITGTITGHGMLIVEGDLRVPGKLDWEGIVIAKKEANLTIEYGGTSRIYGSMVLLQGSSAFNMPVDGRLKVKYISSSAGLQSAVYVHPYNTPPEELFEMGSNRNGDQMSKNSWTTVYKKGQQMNFFIRVYKVKNKNSFTELYDHYGRGHDAPSGKPYALVEQIDKYKWRISFEDLDEDPTRQKAAGYGKPDWDYNDQIIEVEVDCKASESKCDPEAENDGELDPWWDSISGGSGGQGGDGGSGGHTTGSKLTFNMAHQAKVIYSTEAITRLSSKLNVIREASRILTTDRWDN